MHRAGFARDRRVSCVVRPFEKHEVWLLFAGGKENRR
jgi:hypothetical protein